MSCCVRFSIWRRVIKYSSDITTNKWSGIITSGQ